MHSSCTKRYISAYDNDKQWVDDKCFSKMFPSGRRIRRRVSSNLHLYNEHDMFSKLVILNSTTNSGKVDPGDSG